MSSDLLQRMRGHVGYDPQAIHEGRVRANRAERRAAARVVAEQERRIFAQRSTEQEQS